MRMTNDRIVRIAISLLHDTMNRAGFPFERPD
jgi:hypothetical protein